MVSRDESYLMRVPAEIRMMIYGHLLNAGDHSCLAIRNQPQRDASDKRDIHSKRRTRYNVLERSMLRRAYETTYCLDSDVEMHPAILAVNRVIREEASHLLYGSHSFHFGDNIEAVVPFLGDKTTSTLELVKEIAMYKRRPGSMFETDSCDWVSICRYLSTLPRLKKLRLIIEGGRPPTPWDGPQALSLSDFRFLYSTRHECLDWVRALAAGVDTIGAVEIIADIQFMPEPTTNQMIIFAAFSASIETTLVEFLSSELSISASVGPK
jgi:hypothetical protein